MGMTRGFVFKKTKQNESGRGREWVVERRELRKQMTSAVLEPLFYYTVVVKCFDGILLAGLHLEHNLPLALCCAPLDQPGLALADICKD